MRNIAMAFLLAASVVPLVARDDSQSRSASTVCPVSNGSLQIVPPARHIFNSGGVWFGDGPVYINLAWKSDTLPPARFSFSKIPIYSGQPWPAKTPVVAEPSYTGAVSIHGRALDAASTPLMFRGDFGPTKHLELQAPGDRPSDADWSFWATGMIIPQAGCYELQIGTVQKSETIVFEAGR